MFILGVLVTGTWEDDINNRDLKSLYMYEVNNMPATNRGLLCGFWWPLNDHRSFDRHVKQLIAVCFFSIMFRGVKTDLCATRDLLFKKFRQINESIP